MERQIPIVQKHQTSGPTALDRVRAYVREAKAQNEGEVAWIVPEHFDFNQGRLIALTVEDLEAVLGMVKEPPAETAATYADRHPANIADVGRAALEERYHQLVEWHRDPLGVRDPRCGCEEDGEGSRCYWDDYVQIDDELARRDR